MKLGALPSRSRGFSLVEILVSLVIGLVVVAAVIVSIIGAGKAGRYQAAYAQMNEDAQIGLSILSRDLQMAGFAQPTSVTTTGSGASLTLTLTSTNLGASNFIFGCDTGFSSPTASTLACGTATTSAFEVVYEADIRNTVPAGGVPSDCLGNGIPTGPPYVAHNRYFLSAGISGRPELYCASNNAGNTPQPLIENIENMQVRYGTSLLAAPTQVVRYVSASDINGLGAVAAALEWARVVSVRVCLLVRSADPVLNPGDDTVVYRDCGGGLVTPTDRYLRRAYFATATVRDKMP
jgi:type IV pilus assembly protein PilW